MDEMRQRLLVSFVLGAVPGRCSPDVGDAGRSRA